MKQNQKGVSMVSLVITIIVIIILAAVAFSGSQETIGRAGFAGYTTDIDSVRTAFMTEGVTTLMGEETAKNNTVTNAQAYNYLAKGATTNRVSDTNKEHAWLSKAQANAIPCTRIEKVSAKDAIGIELPKRTVNTFGAAGVEIEYFVTNDGVIFTWPPYYRSDDGLFYINDTMPVKGSKVTSGDWIISGDDEAKMYEDEFRFIVGDVEIKVLGTGEDIPALSPDATPDELRNMPSIAYKDERNAEAPEGVETKVVYQDNGGTGEENRNIFSFVIDGVTYQAEEGMTWGSWVESVYNISGYKVLNSITFPNVIVNSENKGVYSSDYGDYVYADTILTNFVELVVVGNSLT